VQVVIPWFWNRREVYQEFYKYWSSPEFKMKSEKNRQNHEKAPNHRHGADGHIRKSQRMVRFRGSSAIFFLYCHATNFKLQAKRDGAVRSDNVVFVKHHRGPDPSNPDQLCSQLATDALLSCHHFSMFCTVVLSLTCISIIFARINMAKKW
jgi:hypothetical protein